MKQTEIKAQFLVVFFEKGHKPSDVDVDTIRFKLDPETLNFTRNFIIVLTCAMTRAVFEECLESIRNDTGFTSKVLDEFPPD